MCVCIPIILHLLSEKTNLLVQKMHRPERFFDWSVGVWGVKIQNIHTDCRRRKKTNPPRIHE